MAVRYGIIKFMKSARIGTIMPWSGDGNTGFSLSNIPQGWIVCDGSLQEATRYPLLASHIGDTYGADAAFGGTFPEFTGKFRVPNMTLQMPIDLEPEYLQQSAYQYGQGDAYNVLVSQTYTGDAYVGGFGSISLTTPIPISHNANVDIDFTVDSSLVMSGKFTNMSIGDPDFGATVYTINRKLGINHTPGHSHPGTYSRATAQFAGPMPFKPPKISTKGGVTGSCVTDKGYTECELTTAEKAESWQEGKNLISFYGDETREYTLPQTDRFFNFVGSSYWNKVPATSWPPPTGTHPSGNQQIASSLGYNFFGGDQAFNVTSPVKSHAQDAWTGVFPKPMTFASRRNFFGPTTNYDPDTSAAHTITGVTIPANTTTITLAAGADIGNDFEFDKVVPFMWVYDSANALFPGTQIVTISRDSGTSSSNYVYTLTLSVASVNTTTQSNVTLSFKHGTFPTTTNNLTSQLDPNSSTFLGHNHGSFEVNMGKGSLSAPSVYAVNDINLGTVQPENIDDALNIIAAVSMPALVTTFLIKAY